MIGTSNTNARPQFTTGDARRVADELAREFAPPARHAVHRGSSSRSWCPLCSSRSAPSLSIAERDGALIFFCHRCHASGDDLLRELVRRGRLPDWRRTAEDFRDRLRAAIDATTWAGRGRSTDRDVLIRLVEIGAKRPIHPGVRKIAESISYSRATVARSLRRLERDGWLEKISVASGELAATWRLCVSRTLGTGSRPDRVAVCDSVAAGCQRHSAFQARELRGVKWRIYELLSTPRTAREIAALLRWRQVRTAQQHLARLVRFDLAHRRTDGRYERSDADLDQLAKKLGVADATARQRAQHAVERDEWRRWCRALQHYAATGEVIDPRSGQILAIAEKPVRPIRLGDFRSLVITRRANTAEELDRSTVNAPSQRVSGEESSLIINCDCSPDLHAEQGVRP